MSFPSTLIANLAAKQAVTTVSISRPTQSIDASHTPVQTYAVVQSGISAVVAIRASINTTIGNEQIRYGRESNRRFGRVHFAPGVDVRPQDRIIHGSDTYDVQAVATPGSRVSTDRLAWIVCEVEETE